MRNSSDIKSEMRNKISEIVHERNSLTLPLSERVLKLDVEIDEQFPVFVQAKAASRSVFSSIPFSVKKIKEQVVPLQGKSWKNWSELIKKSNKTSLYKSLQDEGKIQEGMRQERLAQSRQCANLSVLMASFVENMSQMISSDNICLIFVSYLKQYLDDRSRNILPKTLLDVQND